VEAGARDVSSGIQGSGVASLVGGGVVGIDLAVKKPLRLCWPLEPSFAVDEAVDLVFLSGAPFSSPFAERLLLMGVGTDVGVDGFGFSGEATGF
jgi:hypothetical protein